MKCTLVFANYKSNPLNKEYIGMLLPQLGINSIYTNLKLWHPEWEINVVDAVIRNLGQEETIKEIMLQDPNAVGLSCTYMNLDDVLGIARTIKEKKPGIITIIGGPGAKSLQTLTKGEPIDYVDFCVVGDGEYVMDTILKSNRIPEKTEYCHGFVKNLDDLQFPKRECWDIESYIKENQKIFNFKERLLSLYTSKGCDYGKCTFCSVDVKLRFKSIKTIEDELFYLNAKFDPTIIDLMDDNLFSYNYKERVIQLCNIFRKYEIKWRGETRINDLLRDIHFTRKVLDQMKQSGCIGIYLGAESGDPEILKILGKNISPIDIVNAVKLITTSDIKVLLFFMYNSPGETLETFSRTIFLVQDLIMKYGDNISAIYFWKYANIPGTVNWRLGLEDGRVPSKDLEKLRGDLEELCLSKNIILLFKTYK